MKKRVISAMLGVLMIVCQMWGMGMTVSASDDEIADIGDVTIESYYDLARYLKDVAVVTANDTGSYNVKLTKSIKGRIRFCINDGNIIFDANGKTLYGMGTNEPICIENFYNTKFTLRGNGILVNGVNNAIYSGADDYLYIESGVFIGRINATRGWIVAGEEGPFSIYNITPTTDDKYNLGDAVCEDRTEDYGVSGYPKNICVTVKKNVNEAPKISGITDGEVYCLSAAFTVTDDDLESVKDYVGGQTTVLKSNSNMYILGGGVHTITATDSAGNKTVVRIKVNATHTRGPAATEDTPQMCLICNMVLHEALGHVHRLHLTKADMVESTCTDKGSIECYVCECGKLFADENALTEIAQEDIQLPLKEHVESDWITDVEASYDKAGARHKECTVCGQVLENEEIPVMQSPEKPAEEKPAAPQTGDNSNMVLYVSVLLLSVVGVLAVIPKKRMED